MLPSPSAPGLCRNSSASKGARLLLYTCLVRPLLWDLPAHPGGALSQNSGTVLAVVVWGRLRLLCWRCCNCAPLRGSARLHSVLIYRGCGGAGVHKEALQWPLLLELCCLLPSLHLHVVMVSPSLPDGLHRHIACPLIGASLIPQNWHPGVSLLLFI